LVRTGVQRAGVQRDDGLVVIWRIASFDAVVADTATRRSQEWNEWELLRW
jgi:hypothetical protein